MVGQRIQKIRSLGFFFAYRFQLFGLATTFEEGVASTFVGEFACAFVVRVGHQAYLVDGVAVVGEGVAEPTLVPQRLERLLF